MRTLFAAVSLAVLTAAPAGAEDAEAKLRAEIFTSCHGSYHAMSLLAGKGKYAPDAKANAAAKARFDEADKKAVELARDAYSVNGETEEDATDQLDRAAEEYEEAFDELTEGGSYDRAEMNEDVKKCDELMVGE